MYLSIFVFFFFAWHPVLFHILFQIKKVKKKHAKHVFWGFFFIPGKYVLYDVFCKSFNKDIQPEIQVSPQET